MKQYIAGYIIDNLPGLFEPGSKRLNDVNSLLQRLTHFQVATKSGMEKEEREYPSMIAILINILQRGMPTKMNMFALRNIVDHASLLEFDESNPDEINIRLINPDQDIRKLVFRSLHPIDSRLTIEDLSANYEKTWEALDDKYEIHFLQHELPDALEKILKDQSNYFVQLLARQRPIKNIIERSDRKDLFSSLDLERCDRQPVDYSLELPYYDEGKPHGIVIEIDGSSHKKEDQIEFDKQITNVLRECNWYDTLRLTQEDFKSTDYFYKLKNSLFDIIYGDYISTCRENYFSPLWSDPLGNEVLHLALVPFAVARIQRVFLEAIAKEKLPLNQPSWKIAVLERDVPCGKLALDDLQETLFRLSSLLQEKDRLLLPEIELEVYNTAEFQNSSFQNTRTERIANFKPDRNYDLIIDIGLLEATQAPVLRFQNAQEVITIRSAQYIEADRRICTGSLLQYNPFSVRGKNEINNHWETDTISTNNLEYFLQSIFRKITFRDHQIPILNIALQCQSVIGLLAPGSGKSITYQLSAFLQPGICMIVSPTKSLIKNQVDSLQNNRIDICSSLCNFFDSIHRDELFEQLIAGNIQFLHILPDQLRTREFREILREMHRAGQYFSYCVIDEAHCISEWGHDFRTNYMKLVKFAGNNCKTKNLERLPFFSLTATASDDVVMDIRNDFENFSEENIIKSKSLVGPESQFIIVECNVENMACKSKKIFSDILGAQKQETMIRLLEEIPEKFKGLAPNPAGIIFCPHESGYYGVTDRYNQQALGVFRGSYDNVYLLDNIKAGFYVSSDRQNKDILKKSLSNQDDFQKNKTNLMVATKDFGIGIDEKNIRYTIHLNYPMSIENFVQESGRTVRDGRPTYSFILFNNQQVEIEGEIEKYDHDLAINKTSLEFSRSSFEKEMLMIDEFLDKITSPGNIHLLIRHIREKTGLEVEGHFYIEEDKPGLIFDKNKRETYGSMDLESLEADFSESFEEENSEKIFQTVRDFFQTLEISPRQWLSHCESIAGIREVLAKLNIGDPFEIEFGFSNNISLLTVEIFQWLHEKILNKITQKQVTRWVQNSKNFRDFEIQIDAFLKDEIEAGPNTLAKICGEKGPETDKPSQLSLKALRKLFNQCRYKKDSELAIYRFMLLGIIDGYYINENTSTFIIYGKKKEMSDYQENLMNYLLRFFSHKLIAAKLTSYRYKEKPDTLRKYLYTLLSFSNREILNKQNNAIEIMQDACCRALGKEPYWLKEYLNKFVKYKYLIKGYNYRDGEHNRVTASLHDDTVSGKHHDIQLVWHYIEIVNHDPSGSQIENLRHLRNSVDFLLTENPENFTLLLLKAYTMYMLQYREKNSLDMAEKLLIKAFKGFQNQTKTLNEDILRQNYDHFIQKIKVDNEELQQRMNEYGLEFGFSTIMVSHFLKPLQLANKTLNSLNKILSSIRL
ncbi:MAG: ATP-dependent DNA helicase RecQ [Candidatus Marinimicrobia bacterium]|nr:ATP-dependent DNA helicase RecQ [Candidatus Neomarinimicrobiota bacterium]